MEMKMKKTFVALAASTLIALPALAGTMKKDIVDTAVGAGSFETLVAAVQAAGLVDTLKGEGPFTVFAPTDEAFAALPEGTVEELLMRFTEFFQVLPTLLFAMVIVALFGPTTVNVAAAIGIVSWTGVARLARSEFLRIRGLDYVRAARAVGSRNRRIIWRVILLHGFFWVSLLSCCARMTSKSCSCRLIGITT